MAYKPRVGERKHKSMIGEALAHNDFARHKLAELRAAARNETTKTYIQAIENDLLKQQVTLYEMLALIMGHENE